MKGILHVTRGVVLFALLTLAACGGSSDAPAPAPPPATPGIVALSDVQPIFDANCLTNCHQPGGVGLFSTGMDLSPGTAYGGLYDQPATNLPLLTQTGTRVKPLDGAGSVLLQRINGDIPPLMPFEADPLSAADQALIQRWIDDGASTTGKLQAELSGGQVSASAGGPVTTAASGSASFTLDSDRTTISYLLDLGVETDFSSPVTSIRIHARNPGSLDGPAIFEVPLPITLPAVLSFNGTLTAADLQAQGTIASFADAVTALLAGTTYLQVTTAGHAGGETRGQIGHQQFPALSLDGTQVVPAPVATTAAGTGTVTINPDHDAISVHLDLGNATSFSSLLTAAQIRFGAAGANGAKLFDLPLPQPQPARPKVNIVLTAADLNASQSDAASFAAAVDAMLSGKTYVQIATLQNGSGEIRGQILP